MVTPPQSASERWDEIAAKVIRAASGDRGERWVLVGVWPSETRGGRNDLVRRALARRGLDVMVVSRKGFGEGSPIRPWTGWRTWARLK